MHGLIQWFRGGNVVCLSNQLPELGWEAQKPHSAFCMRTVGMRTHSCDSLLPAGTRRSLVSALLWDARAGPEGMTVQQHHGVIVRLSVCPSFLSFKSGMTQQLIKDLLLIMLLMRKNNLIVFCSTL